MFQKKSVISLFTVICFNFLVSCQSPTSVIPAPSEKNSIPQKNDGVIQYISVSKCKLLVEKYPDLAIIDVRTPEEFKQGHLQGAQLVNVEDEKFKAQLARFDKQKQVLVYCNSGARSAEACQIMRQAGFTKIFNMSKGLQDWVEHKFPTTTLTD